MIWTRRTTGDDGVSESIGFLLIFTMVIVGIGLVTLYGYPMLLQQQTSADKQIMQKNMIVLQNDVKSLAFKTVPYKETMLNTGSGSLTVYPSDPLLTPTPISKIWIRDTTAGDYVTDFRPGDLRYYSSAAGVDISLQDGAVVTHNLVEQGSAMIAEPRWFYDERANTMVVSLIALNSSTKISMSGIGTVQTRMNQTNYSVHGPTSGTTCVKYTFPDANQDYSLAWQNYFIYTLKLSKGTGADCATDEYRLPLRAGGWLVVKKYDVDIVSL
jgi:hypothetical protein